MPSAPLFLLSWLTGVFTALAAFGFVPPCECNFPCHGHLCISLSNIAFVESCLSFRASRTGRGRLKRAVEG